MKTWYKAVCEQHKEMIDILVHAHAPDATAGVFVHEYLKDKEGDIITWLMLHSWCNVKIISRDEQLDDAFNKGVEVVL